MNDTFGVLRDAGFACSMLGDAQFARRPGAEFLVVVETAPGAVAAAIDALASPPADSPFDMLVIPAQHFDLAPVLGAQSWSAYRHAVVLLTGPRPAIVPGALTGRAVEYRFTGKASHASTAPERGANALESAIHTLYLVNALRQHLLSEIRIDMTMPHGGEAPNIVPERSIVRAWVRAPGMSSLRQTLLKIRDAARSAAIANRGSVEGEPLTDEIPGLFSPPALVNASLRAVETLGITKIGQFETPPLAAGILGQSLPTIGLALPAPEFAILQPAIRALADVPASVLDVARREIVARKARIQAFAESNGVGSPVC